MARRAGSQMMARWRFGRPIVVTGGVVSGGILASGLYRYKWPLSVQYVVERAMKTWSARACDIEKKWFVIDASGVIVGRLATFIAMRLRGKHKPGFTPHMDCGDNIIVVNAREVALTGNKLAQKKYYRHTGYPGGIKERVAGKILSGRFPERVLSKAVERMMPGGPLSRAQLGNLRIYAGAEHPHEAQRPEVIEFRNAHAKNTVRG